MKPLKGVAFGLLALPAAEIAAFIAVASLIGIGAAVVLLVLISFTGVLVLRKVGGSTMTHLRAAPAQTPNAILGGTAVASALGGILLLIPGFITGLLGALVVFPVSRGWLLSRFRRLFSSDGSRAGPQIVDLAPGEWQVLPNPKLPPRKRRPKA
jgi:UPF0716 protein FxsA